MRRKYFLSSYVSSSHLLSPMMELSRTHWDLPVTNLGICISLSLGYIIIVVHTYPYSFLLDLFLPRTGFSSIQFPSLSDRLCIKPLVKLLIYIEHTHVKVTTIIRRSRDIAEHKKLVFSSFLCYFFKKTILLFLKEHLPRPTHREKERNTILLFTAVENYNLFLVYANSYCIYLRTSKIISVLPNLFSSFTWQFICEFLIKN